MVSMIENMILSFLKTGIENFADEEVLPFLQRIESWVQTEIKKLTGSGE